jgi:hypothetical protein
MVLNTKACWVVVPMVLLLLRLGPYARWLALVDTHHPSQLSSSLQESQKSIPDCQKLN